MNYWRIYHFINSTLRAWSRKTYLEVGAEIGLNIRKVEAREKYGSSLEKIPRGWLSYQWEMDGETFCELVARDYKEKFGVIFLRDWKAENLEQRVRSLYPSLMTDGVLIVEGYDITGTKNEAWRLAVGLKSRGIPCGTLKGKYLIIYKPEEEMTIPRKVSSRMRLETYLKKSDTLLETV